MANTANSKQWLILVAQNLPVLRIYMLLGLLDLNPDPLVWIRKRIRLQIRILLSSNKNSKKNLDSYCFVTSFRLFIFKNAVNISSKSYKQKNLIKKLVFFGVLKVNDENSRIRRRGSVDPDPHQNVMDPQHWNLHVNKK